MGSNNRVPQERAFLECFEPALEAVKRDSQFSELPPRETPPEHGHAPTNLHLCAGGSGAGAITR